jgi:hypothetical protein
MSIRHYLHGDYLEPADRNPTSIVYCAFCDGYCLPQHLYDEHEIDQNMLRLNASRKASIATGRGSNVRKARNQGVSLAPRWQPAIANRETAGWRLSRGETTKLQLLASGRPT